MNVTALSLKRPLTVVMVFLMLVLLGIDGYFHLPVRRFPQLTIPAAQVVVKDPGAAPNTVMTTIANPIENQLATLPGLYLLKAQSMTGQARIVVEFAQGTSASADLNQVNSAMQAVARRLPSGASYPSVIQANPSSLPVLNIAIQGNPQKTSQWVTTTLVPKLEEVSGVGQVQVAGNTVPEAQILINRSDLANHHLTVADVGQQVSQANQSIAAGSSTYGSQTQSVVVHGRITSLIQLQNLSIATPPVSRRSLPGLIPLHDLASVQMTATPLTTMASLNGHPAVGLSISEQTNANTIAVTHALLTTISQIQPPSGIHLRATSNVATFTQQSIASTQVDLFLAIFLAGLVLFLFLHRLRHTIIVIIAIPVSLSITFGIMWALGFSIDLISLMALSLLIGFLVDDAIVVLENIARHQALGKTPWQAAFDGRMEIGGAAVAITLTDVVVYLPLALAGGQVGAMFREFGLTIVSATLLSLLVSFTLTPLMAARWAKPFERTPAWAHWWTAGLNRLQTFYTRVLNGVLSRRLVASLVVLASLGATMLFFPLGWIHTAFIPAEDTGLFTVSLSLPPGTPLATTQSKIVTLSRQIKALSGVSTVFATAGTGGQADQASLDVQLTTSPRRPSIFQIEAQTQHFIHRIPHATATTVTANPLTPGTKAPITVHVLGPHFSQVAHIASEVTAKLHKLPQLTQVINQSPLTLPETQISLSHSAMVQNGVSPSAVADTVKSATGGWTISTYQARHSTTSSNMVISTGSLSRAQIMALQVPTSSGTVPLSTVAHIVNTHTAPTLKQQNRLYDNTISANLKGTAPLGPAVKSVQKTIAGIHVPSGYQVVYGGQVHQQKTTLGPLFGALGLSVILVYMLLAALYESLILPLAIMLTVPLSSIGALTALALTGQSMNIFTIVGLIMLMGIVTKNAILLVDYTQTLRTRGLPRKDALIEAGRTRLRPIIMTTMTMVVSMMPLALSLGTGSADHQSMAIAVIGGLLSSTLLTLIVIPVAYSYLDDWFPWALNLKVPSTKSQLDASASQ